MLPPQKPGAGRGGHRAGGCGHTDSEVSTGSGGGAGGPIRGGCCGQGGVSGVDASGHPSARPLWPVRGTRQPVEGRSGRSPCWRVRPEMGWGALREHGALSDVSLPCTAPVEDPHSSPAEGPGGGGGEEGPGAGDCVCVSPFCPRAVHCCLHVTAWGPKLPPQRRHQTAWMEEGSISDAKRVGVLSRHRDERHPSFGRRPHWAPSLSRAAEGHARPPSSTLQRTVPSVRGTLFLRIQQTVVHSRKTGLW